MSDIYSVYDAGHVEHNEPSQPQAGLLQHANGSKRKADISVSPSPKKAKFSESSQDLNSTVPRCKQLLPAIWQRVFLHLDPPSLGRLLSVNRAFHFYLTSVRNVQDESASSGFVKLQTSESIWTASRRQDITLPKPLLGLNELDMLKLIKGHGCQFCHKTGYPQSDDPWWRGPGRTGVRIVWAFGIRTCGPCLEARTQTDIKLMISSSSALLPGLPFIFITQDKHAVSASVVQTAGTIPAGFQMRKCYYIAHVSEIQEELEEVKALNSGIGEEWFKGLESRRRERLADADRCERWETSHAASSTVQTAQIVAPEPRGWETIASQPTLYSPAPIAPYSAPVTAFTAQSNYIYPLPHTPQTLPPPHVFQPPTQPTYGPPPHTPTYHQAYAPPQTTQQKPDRSIRDVTEAKAARRKDIEDRCMALDPPIPAKVLRHMDSFKAALQLTFPMTDQGWEQLKPRLLAQREAAEEQERVQSAHLAMVQAKALDRRHQEASQKEIKENQDRDWEDAQKPIRAELAAFADEIIASKWNNGKRVTKESAPQFAVDVLIHVDKRFFENATPYGPDGAPRMLNGQERKLILENMKWVFDHKIKHITERYRKELFLCSGCEGNPKYYGFEGVIQHYGAKHTNAFSVGNIVVHWKESEWPSDEPPFELEPANAKANGHHSGYPGFASSPAFGYRGTSTTPQMNAHMLNPQFSPAPGTGQHQGYVPGPFRPPTGPAESHSLDATRGPPNTGLSAANSQKSPDVITAHTQGHLRNQSRNVLGHGFASPERRNPAISEEQVSQFAEKFRLKWSSLSGIEDLPNAVRFYVVIQTLCTAYKDWHGREPELDLLIQGLQDAPTLQSIKNAAGLDCKICSEASTSSISRGFPMLNDRSGYSILALARHFKHNHVLEQDSKVSVSAGRQKGDWAADMIALPDSQYIAKLAHAEGMSSERLRLFRDVFPTLFSVPADVVQGSVPYRSYQENSRSSGPSNTATGAFIDRTREELSPQFGPDEYDPRRPVLDRNRSSVRSRPRATSYRSPGLDEYHREVIYVARDRPDGYAPLRGQGYLDDSEPLPWNPEGSGGPRARPHREIYYAEREPIEYPEPLYRPRSGHRNPACADLDTRREHRGNREYERRIEREAPPPTSPGSIAAAEEADRFLHNLTAADDAEAHKRAADEPLQQRTDVDVSQHLPSQAPDREGLVARREDADPRIKLEHDAPGLDNYARSHQSDDPYDHGYASVPRREVRQRPHQQRRRDRDPEHTTSSRYARYMRVYREDPSYHGQRTARPHSRYDRYDAQRRQIERSQSPSQRGSEVPESFRDPSLAPNRGGQPSPLDPPSMRGEAYSPAPARIRYQYEEQPPPSYFDEYGRSVQYIRVHEPAPAAPRQRYAGFPGEPGHVYEYIPDHQRPPRHESIYYEPAPSYAYRADRPPPPRPEAEGSVYEPEPRATPAAL